MQGLRAAVTDDAARDLSEGSIEDGIAAGGDGARVVRADVVGVDAEAERVGVVHAVVREQVIDDLDRVVAVVVAVTADVVDDEEQAAAVLYESHDGRLLGGAEADVRLGDDELV